MRVSSLLLLTFAIGCGDNTREIRPRQPCETVHPNKEVFWGDLHVHTSYSFDANSYGLRNTPDFAYRFAKGEPVSIGDEATGAAKSVTIDRPLDFMAVTDHGEFLGEVAICYDSSQPGYESTFCQEQRDEPGRGAVNFGTQTSFVFDRLNEICGNEENCLKAARTRWKQLQADAETHYDRTEQCSFTTFIGYEYTNTLDVSNLHRNIIFANEHVTPLPVTHYEAPDPMELLRTLRDDCRINDALCDVISIPHNSNLSNGKLFFPPSMQTDEMESAQEIALLRQEMEPIVEIHQHKGESECRQGFPDPFATNDARCNFEKLRPSDDPVCPFEEPGSFGMRVDGCVHPLDFSRNVFMEGLRQQDELTINPFAMGVIGSTDTHNGTPGHVSSVEFPGHVGLADDTPEKRLSPGTVTHDGLINNPGGLTAVWAQNNTREDIFAALKKRETYATSGPRIRLRFFASDRFSDNLCEQENWVETAYEFGVPMGEVFSLGPNLPPQFIVYAQQDEGTIDVPGTLLQEIELIKLWTDQNGVHQEVIPIAGDKNNGATVNSTTCTPEGPGFESLCRQWTDNDYSTNQNAMYYVRVVENPSCRWSARECLSLPEPKPEGCSDPSIPQTVQQRAWSSPIWIRPKSF